MRINKSEQVSPWDIDGTLIIHLSDNQLVMHPKVDVYDAVTKKFITVGINTPMVRLLREEAHRGACIKVWSRGGWEWAANVIKALGLVTCVDEVMSKPMVYFDDIPIEQWLPYRVFIAPDTVYKNGG